MPWNPDRHRWLAETVKRKLSERSLLERVGGFSPKSLFFPPVLNQSYRYPEKVWRESGVKAPPVIVYVSQSLGLRVREVVFGDDDSPRGASLEIHFTEGEDSFWAPLPPIEKGHGGWSYILDPKKSRGGFALKELITLGRLLDDPHKINCLFIVLEPDPEGKLRGKGYRLIINEAMVAETRWKEVVLAAPPPDMVLYQAKKKSRKLLEVQNPYWRRMGGERRGRIPDSSTNVYMTVDKDEHGYEVRVMLCGLKEDLDLEEIERMVKTGRWTNLCSPEAPSGHRLCLTVSWDEGRKQKCWAVIKRSPAASQDWLFFANLRGITPLMIMNLIMKLEPSFHESPEPSPVEAESALGQRDNDLARERLQELAQKYLPPQRPKR